MSKKPYTAKTISGAQSRVRELTKMHQQTVKLLDRYAYERKLLARLAAKTGRSDELFDLMQAIQKEASQ
jgi:hypothetical protein